MRNLELCEATSSIDRVALRIIKGVPRGFEESFKRLLAATPELAEFHPTIEGEFLMVDMGPNVANSFDRLVGSVFFELENYQEIDLQIRAKFQELKRKAIADFKIENGIE